MIQLSAMEPAVDTLEALVVITFLFVAGLELFVYKIEILIGILHRIYSMIFSFNSLHVRFFAASARVLSFWRQIRKLKVVISL